MKIVYYTHNFAHRQTLDRACSWLTRLGFRMDQIVRHDDGHPRLAFSVEAGRLPEVAMLINAVEHSDPEGWPSFWETAKQHRTDSHQFAEIGADKEPAISTKLAIGWHPIDGAVEVVPNLR